MVPFLKWPGGKRWLIWQRSHVLPRQFERYIEPFLGGGSVYFFLEPRRAILSDVNAELIATYQAIKEQHQGVERALRRYQKLHSESYYYQVRDRLGRSAVSRAARMIYLNRVCFNGIYRVNLEGHFNVPIGTKTTVLMDTDDFGATAKLLSTARLFRSDFECIIDKADEGDFVFVDPPYTVRHNNNGFLKYNEKLFSWDDQKRLVLALARAKKRGAMIVATNANHQPLRRMYWKAGFSMESAGRYSSISSSSDSRKEFKELIIKGNL